VAEQEKRSDEDDETAVLSDGTVEKLLTTFGAGANRRVVLTTKGVSLKKLVEMSK
tara:strand:+ start:182 stop:346 length:165 start_codon:yes stop_codon:yes gene_type:complete